MLSPALDNPALMPQQARIMTWCLATKQVESMRACVMCVRVLHRCSVLLLDQELQEFVVYCSQSSVADKCFSAGQCYACLPVNPDRLATLCPGLAALPSLQLLTQCKASDIDTISLLFPLPSAAVCMWWCWPRILSMCCTLATPC